MTEALENANRKIESSDLWFIIMSIYEIKSNYIKCEINFCNKTLQTVHLIEMCQSNIEGEVGKQNHEVKQAYSINE